MSCEIYPKKINKYMIDTNKIDDNNLCKLSYTKLYLIASEKKIKRRSLMNKLNLIEAILLVLQKN